VFIRLPVYILKQLTGTAFSVGFVVIGSLWAIQSLKFVELVLNTHSSIWNLLKLSFLVLPDLLAIILPIATFISVLVVYNKLSTGREIIVMKAAGVSEWELAKPAYIFAVAIMSLLYFINIYIAPSSFRSLRDLQIQLKNSLPAILVQEGTFNTFQNTTIYVREKNKNQLKGIFAYIIDKEGQKSYAIMAEEGRIIYGSKDDPQILMVNGNRQEFTGSTKALSILYFEKTLLSLTTPATSSQARSYRPYELSLKALLFPDPKLPKPSQLSLKAEGHQRLLTPLLVLVFALVAVSFLLKGQFSRRGQGISIAFATIVAVSLQCLIFLFVNLGAKYPYVLGMAYGALLGTIGLSIKALVSSKKRGISSPTEN
jgi:lipopolysaccharide export system permease protein